MEVDSINTEEFQSCLKRLRENTKNEELTPKILELEKHALQLSLGEIIRSLAELLVETEDLKLCLLYFPNVLLAIVSYRIPALSFITKDFKESSDDNRLRHLRNSISLAALCEHPDILQYALKYFEANPVAPFQVYINGKDDYSVSIKKRKLQVDGSIQDKDVVNCCYQLLVKLPNEFSNKWDWSDFITEFGSHEDSEIRWMIKECISILTNMTDSQSRSLSENMKLTDVDTLNKYLSDMKVTPYFNENTTFPDFKSENIVNIHGIMLPVFEKNNVGAGKLVPVKSTMNNLRSLALAVASGQAICLMGPVGSGKTTLVEHLANLTGRKGRAFKKVQLGDQTDSRMLLGSHQCTDVPGEFVWRPGVLTDAVQNGHWLLLEDIDCAALDVASTLSCLLERKTLSVPGYSDSLPVTPGFQLFVTQRTIVTHYGFQKKMSNSSALLNKHLTQINIQPLSRAELAKIIKELYPILSSICERMIEVFMMFSDGNHDTSLSSNKNAHKKDENETYKDIKAIRGSRLISTRDLMKWCARSVIGFDVTSPESALKVLQDALDIFACSISSPEHRLDIAKLIGTCLGIIETKPEFYCRHHKPNVSLTPTALEVGRAKVIRKQKELDAIDFDNKQTVFSFTRQSACLLERIACCVMSNEPVLLVGETGTGKTSSVQYLARQTGHKLVVINMNQQSDSADLLGGYKPVDMKYVIRPIRNEFENLFKNFYNIEKNQKFLNHINSCYETENWNALLALMKQSHKAAVSRLKAENNDKLKIWLQFGTKLDKLEHQLKAAARLTFAFIEGSLVKAMQHGYWVLLDEINLASAEILECLAGLLEDKNETIDLLEKGDKVPIKRHTDFTLFACMNPATDVGKKDLPVGLRNRFTEFFIDELTEKNDLLLLIKDYLYHMNLDGKILEAIYWFYATIKKEASLNLVDGAGNAPHYSLRTLCRALTAAAQAKCGTVSRSLYEAFCLSFLTQLDSSSHPKVEAMIAKAVIGKKNIKSVINQLIPEPQVPGQNYLLFEGHWIPQGKLDIAIPDGYILTQTVRKNLRDIARIISLGRLPVLLQGDTSVGKTSLITYIAKASGNYCVRINNHEHTDLQEYIGSYATDANGKLVFKEGVLVEAMRKGYWIILDELNLAPSDVLEALNRVLDDNRELFIPETQQVIKADPNFMLFATQNPPGLYGGRKMLSRAFRNRFVELHFDEIPRSELEVILHQRCHIPPTYCKKMIAVMAELQVRRRGSAAVQGKDGFITLRDLFRWGQRYKLTSKEKLTENKFYDWDQHIADEGYLILAGKVRQPDERNIIEQVLEKYIKRKVNPDNLFSLHPSTSAVTKTILESILNYQAREFSHVVWTYNMRRLAVLIAKCFVFNEPVLLVGETGCGKTTICQVLAALRKANLLSINCHMHTESSDFLGGLRPVRQYKNDGRLFEWVDGPLIKAMEIGEMFLADEISLADDSVLERLNSLLEPERQLVLAERGMEENSDIVVITAEQGFQFVGTMNPGGDFGKKELSPALRNRFTEIWCDSVTSRQDLLQVLERSVEKGLSLGNQEDGSTGIGNSILNFTDWLKKSEVTNKFPFSIRDLLSWVNFINVTVTKGLLDTPEAYVHGACMTFLDCFGTALTGHIATETLKRLRKNAINLLLHQIRTLTNDTETLRDTLTSINRVQAIKERDKFGIKPFFIQTGPHKTVNEVNFTFAAPTTGSNTLRLLRGLQLNKAILMEGNPGVGKTSLVTALAKASGHKVVRINLSDQTDITDLFGTDLPSEDGSFTFKEGAFLTALKNGDWILLDELNLAPQPVLEGLNACLDHRGEVFIPELGKTFKIKPQTRLFACQNPLKQGGARRGLPISFLNRFTQVYVDILTHDDLLFIVETQYSSLPKDILHKIVKFNSKIAWEITKLQSWAHSGAPWEMNLRDIQRWCEALIQDQSKGKNLAPGKFVDMLYVNRMRTETDKQKMIAAYEVIFYPDYPRSSQTPLFDINENEIIIGDVSLKRVKDKSFKNKRSFKTNLVVLRHQLPVLKAIAQGVKMNWLTILVGNTGTGKSSVVQLLADLTGNELKVIPVTSAMDVSDLLGGFDQVDYSRSLEILYDEIETLTIRVVKDNLLENTNWKASNLIKNLHEYKKLHSLNESGSSEGLNLFNRKIDFLIDLCQKLVQNDITNESTQHIEDIYAKLNKLKTKMCNVTSINVGGKFEWIDSLLVKTMMEGSWLLLDNVNLTSSAVLDRLNGLLEPNGVLSIPERGEISELKPHKNFRVFFTMDPKFGEISRAMRNRGVEVFILKIEDMAKSGPYMDLVALLSSTGLPLWILDTFIDIHISLCEYIEGLEKPGTTHLLQAARLTTQQIRRGIDHRIGIVNSFTDVYIRPRCDGELTTEEWSEYPEVTKLSHKKRHLITEVDDRVRWITYDEAISNNEFETHTLTAQGLCSNSKFELTKQVSFLPLETAHSYGAKNKIDMLSSLFTAYLSCHNENIYVMHHLLNEMIVTENKMNVFVLEWNKAAFDAMSEDSNVELRKRYYSEVYQHNEKEINEYNTKAVKLYNHLFLEYCKNVIQTGQYSALDYAELAYTGQISDEFTECPIVFYCQRYVDLVDKYIEIGINECQLSDENACKLMTLLKWRERFVKICSEPLLVKKHKKKLAFEEDIVPLIYSHSKWLQKYLMLQLSQWKSKDSDWYKNYETKLSRVTLLDAFTKQNTQLIKIGKKLRKMYGQPKLHEKDLQFLICKAKSRVYNELYLDLAKPIERQLYKINNPACKTITEDNIELMQENISKIIRDLLANIQASSEAKITKVLNLKLLPLKYYINHRIISLLRSDFLDITTDIALENDVNLRQSSKELLYYLIDVLKVTEGFPLALLNMMQVIKVCLEYGPNSIKQSLSSLPARFWDELCRVLTCSPTTYPLPFLDQQPLDVEELTVPNSSERVNADMGLLPYYVQKLTVSTGEEEVRHSLAYEKVSLEECGEYSLQLESLLNLIWNNMSTLETTAALKIKTDVKFEMKKFQTLIENFHTILRPNEKQFPFLHKVSTIVEILQTYLKDVKTNLIDIFTEAISVYFEMIENVKVNNYLKLRATTIKLSLLTGLIQLRIISEVSQVDQIEKYKLKYQYSKDDIETYEYLLSSFYVQGLINGTIQSSDAWFTSSNVDFRYFQKGSEKIAQLINVHPYCKSLLELKFQTEERMEKYLEGNCYRNDKNDYGKFVKECDHFIKSVLSNKTIKSIVDNWLSCTTKLTEDIHLKSISNRYVTDNLREISTWLYTVEAFYNTIQKYTDTIPELAKPLQSSLSQVISAVTAVSDFLKEMLIKREKGPVLNEFAKDLMVYPNKFKGSGKAYLSRYICDEYTLLLFRIVCQNKGAFSADVECVEMLKMNLTELKMYSYALERVDSTLFGVVSTTLDSIVAAWKNQVKEIELKQQEDEALYVTKSKCEDIDDETLASQEIMEMFPSYSEQDFNDFNGPLLEQKKDVQKPMKPEQLLSQSDVTSVYKWHSNFVRNMTVAEWLPAQNKMVGFDSVKALMQRYTVFSRVIQNNWKVVDSEFEAVVAPSLMVLVAQIKAHLDGEEESNEKPDFYHSPWVAETRQCLPLLLRVKETTKGLLDIWPDFPTLKDILQIVSRILSFPVTSPVSRFLTGLELLRDKVEEWNKNAHKANNMIHLSLEIGQQIVNWRKLEMANWKECLNSVLHRMQSSAHKYWFYLYTVSQSYLSPSPEAVETPSRVVEVLREFLERGNVAEFPVRLDMLYVFHCHLVHAHRTTRRDELLSILWNTYNYYLQFATSVSSYIKEKRAPIEKKLRDFVKICTWDRDLSYWSVKETVDKAHKTLHKHTKEFESILKEPVLPRLVEPPPDSPPDHVGMWDRPKRTTTSTATSSPNSSHPRGGYMVDVVQFTLQPRTVKKQLDQTEAPCDIVPESSLLSKVASLLHKAKSLCKDTINNTGYPALVQGLDDFVTAVIETSNHLGGLEVDASLSKEKQTSQAKSMLQQKRKAVSDLFRYLSKMGLNYRTGLVILQGDCDLYDFTIPPVDLEAVIGYLKSRRCDASLSQLWSGCEKYFQKNIARHRALSTALLTPHQDLGMQNVDRCKGFAAHLLKLTNAQKKSISKYSRHLSEIRLLTTNLTNILDLDKNVNISTMNERIHILTQYYGNVSIVLEQFEVILKSCPESSLNIENIPHFDSIISKSPIMKCCKHSPEWTDLHTKTKQLISIVTKQKTALRKLRSSLPKVLGNENETVPIVSQNHVDVTKEANERLVDINNIILSILNEYGIQLTIDDKVEQHPILKCLKTVYVNIGNATDVINKLTEKSDVTMEEVTNTEIVTKTEDLIATMLLIIQSVYKKHLTKISSREVLDAIDKLIDSEESTETESKDILEDNHLKELLQEKLTSDVKSLQIDHLNSKLKDLILSYIEYTSHAKDDEQVKNVMIRVVPILEQTMLFVQYFVTQQVAVHRVSCKMLSVILKIFTDLTTKGFCFPSDLDMSEGEGEGGPGRVTGGTGLGEGEGQTDVSDRIENQDQLDDATRPGEEKKEEERDCKEEEKGVNMTDDFDSHLQDVDKKEGEPDQDDEEDDADKQMGDIDNAAEKLDQQIWGSDEEDEQDQPSQKEKEDKGTGESTGEKEMAAKEQESGKDNETKGKERKKQKDINEMEDMEVDDDHTDNQYGNEPKYPEPEDFEIPDNEREGDEPPDDDDKEGETETENPFELNIPKELEDVEEEKKEHNEEGLHFSSDEDDGDGDQENPSESQDQPSDPNPESKDETEPPKDQVDPDDTEGQHPENLDQEEQKEEEKEDEDRDMQRNEDKMGEEDQVEEKKLDANPEANPSTSDPTSGDVAETAENARGTGDNVHVNPDQEKDEDAAPFEQPQEQVGDERQGVGRSDLDKSESGHGGQKQKANRTERENKNDRMENKPGRTEQERTLGDVTEKRHKKHRTLNVENDDDDAADDGDGNDDEQDNDADAYQHVKQAGKDDVQTIDAATREQADEQATIQQEEEEATPLQEDDEVAMDVDDDQQVEKAEKELAPEKFKQQNKDKEKDKSGNKNEGDDATGETGIEVEGDNVMTSTVPRGIESTYHTQLQSVPTSRAEDLPMSEYVSYHSGLHPVSGVSQVSSEWGRHWRGAEERARTLTQALRLILEPTGRSRMAGDFRTGRAINMRRVIPYIASHFRKDRIWLRRTRPAKREYKIAIAVDDSSSMSDNRSKQLAFESLALVSQALTLLESGDLAVLSFGENTNLLHPFSEQFSEHSGSKILEKLLFDQTKTKIAQLLDFSTVMFEQQNVQSDAVNAKLLVIVSDGRGIFSEGETKVLQAVRRARQQGIFLVYVIIDNPDNKDSIMDIRRPIFDPVNNSLTGFVPYLDTFPFPFYIILRDMTALPTVLGDALRQWFEIAANTSL